MDCFFYERQFNEEEFNEMDFYEEDFYEYIDNMYYSIIEIIEGIKTDFMTVINEYGEFSSL